MTLHRHLIAETAPVALPENTVIHGDYRVTVMSDRLFRVERSAGGVFNDDATQAVWFRNMPAQKFAVKRDGENLLITTAAAVLTVAPVWEDCTVEMDGIPHPLANDTENLKGTARTLDAYNGEYHVVDGHHIHLDSGVCSRSGIAVVDDTGALRLDTDGKLKPAASNERDVYVFAFGRDYRASVQALYAITGRTPLLPRYALGNWWSRYHRYTDEEYLWLMDKFEAARVPLTVATVDMDWHYANFVLEEKRILADGKATADRGCIYDPADPGWLGWTGYSWNKALFPDYKAFLRELRARDLHVTLNLHPAGGVRYFEDMYPEMANAMGMDPAEERLIEFDISNPRFINAYFDVLHRPYEDDGVDFWWIDWQQGTTSRMAGLDPLWALNHYHFLDNGDRHERPLIMSRYAGVGSHRYPVGFSGDTTITWESLAYIPYFTATASNIGYTWWSHDIGGHMNGAKDDELYLRYVQFGVFNPINRLHSSNSPVYTKEPWAFKNGTGELAADAMRFRHRLIPYLYSCNHDTHESGIALCEPIYYRYPDAEQAYAARNEYFFGPSLLVAPVITPSVDKGLSVTEVFLPEGFYTDIFTGDTYDVPAGGATYEMVRPLDSIPVLALAGSVLPLGLDEGNSTDNPHRLEVRIFNGDGRYDLYEDEGERFAFTHFVLEGGNGVQTVTVSTDGDTELIPADRELLLTFSNIEVHNQGYVNDPVVWARRDLCRVTVLKNGTETAAKVDAFGIVHVTIRDFDPTATYTVKVEYEQIDAVERFKRLFWNKILPVESTVFEKEQLDHTIRTLESPTIDAVVGAIKRSSLSQIDKMRLCENVLYRT